MSNENVLDFYEDLDFEEAEIEERLTALFFEIAPDANYALITDEAGAIPETLKKPIIFTYYTPAGAFLWSTGFKNSHLFRDVWDTAKTPEKKIESVEQHRESADYYK